MAVWLRLRQYLDGKWSLGYEIPTDFCEFAGSISYSRLYRLYWLEIKNDEEWYLLGEKNLCAILSNQKKQLRAVKATRQSSPEDSQKIANDYTTALVQFEKICASVEPAHDENQVPPILPWLRPDDYFKEGDKVIGWENLLPFSWYVGYTSYWSPFLQEITCILDNKVQFSVALGPNDHYITSPKTMLVQEAKYYSENDSYRQFLLERLKSTDRTFPEILSALGDKKRLKSVL